MWIWPDWEEFGEQNNEPERVETGGGTRSETCSVTEEEVKLESDFKYTEDRNCNL